MREYIELINLARDLNKNGVTRRPKKSDDLSQYLTTTVKRKK